MKLDISQVVKRINGQVMKEMDGVGEDAQMRDAVLSDVIIFTCVGSNEGSGADKLRAGRLGQKVQAAVDSDETTVDVSEKDLEWLRERSGTINSVETHLVLHDAIEIVLNPPAEEEDETAKSDDE